MEPGQRDHIHKNLPELLKNTLCTDMFLAYLLQDELIRPEEIDLIRAQATPTGQAAKFYEIILTRSKSYNGLQRALEKTCQSGALDIFNNYACVGNEREAPPEAIKEASVWNPVLLQNPRNVSYLANKLKEPPPQTKPEESDQQKILAKQNHLITGGEMTSNLSRTWIGSQFNSWLGRNTTHLRNDSSKSIVAVIIACQGSISQVGVNEEGRITVNFKNNMDQRIFKGLIPPGKLMGFERANATDYLTIMVRESDGKVTETASDVIIRANNSFRVDEDGIPHFLNYGEL